MEYPYEEIYGCLIFTGIEEGRKVLGANGLQYEEISDPYDAQEYYRTDNNIFLLYSLNHNNYTPFWPHKCWDHALYILQSWKLNGLMLKTEGKKYKWIHQEMFGKTMMECVSAIMESDDLFNFNITGVWELIEETRLVFERFLETARKIDGITINLSTKRI